MSRRTYGIVALVGIVLLVFGISAANSFGSEVSTAFTGTPTDEAMWLEIGGGVITAIGLYGWFRKPTSQPHA